MKDSRVYLIHVGVGTEKVEEDDEALRRRGCI
jgi:hypothetical protein